MRVLLTLGFFVLLSGTAQAQWVPRPGEGTVSFTYQFTRAYDHLFSQNVDGVVAPGTGYIGGPGKHFYLGDIFGQSQELSADLGLWRGLAGSVSAAYVISKYSGLTPEGPDDDGRYHGGLQDFAGSLRYMMLWQEFSVTPGVSLRIPLTDYDQLGHVSIGKGLDEWAPGLAVGRSLSPWLPNAYVAGSFTFALVEDHHDHELDQRRYSVDAGYIVNDRVAMGGSLQHVNTVDGIDWLTDIVTEQNFHDHDVAAKARFTRVGAFMSVSPRQTFGFRLSFMATVAGVNTHSTQSVTITPYWNFHAPFGH